MVRRHVLAATFLYLGSQIYQDDNSWLMLEPEDANRV